MLLHVWAVRNCFQTYQVPCQKKRKPPKTVIFFFDWEVDMSEHTIRLNILCWPTYPIFRMVLCLDFEKINFEYIRNEIVWNSKIRRNRVWKCERFSVTGTCIFGVGLSVRDTPWHASSFHNYQIHAYQNRCFHPNNFDEHFLNTVIYFWKVDKFNIT